MPSLRDGRLLDRVTTSDSRRSRTTSVSLRAGAGNRRGRRRRTVAGSSRSHVACVARARRGDLRCDVLLRIGHALLPGPCLGPRRSNAVAHRAAPLCTVARRGASTPPPHADPHGRRPCRSRNRRDANTDRMRRQELPLRRLDRDPASPSLGRERMAQRGDEPTATRQGAHPRSARDHQARRPSLTRGLRVCDDALR